MQGPQHDGVVEFTVATEGDALRQLQELAAKLRTNRASDTNNTHHRITQARAEQLQYGRQRITAEQVFNSERAERIVAGPAGDEVIDQGGLQHRGRLAL